MRKASYSGRLWRAAAFRASTSGRWRLDAGTRWPRVRSGHPVTGLRVTLTDGATHPKDSSEMAFRTAGRLGLREALRASVMRLLEPVAEVTVTVPDDTMGGVLGDLAARRGHVLDSTVRAGTADCHRDRAAG